MLPRFSLGRFGYVVLATTLLLIGLAATAARTIRQYQTPGPFDPSRQGMCDFHNGIYFPTRAVLAGISPYGQPYADSNPVARQIPFFSPSILVLHTPFALLPLRVAEVLYFALSIAVLVAIGVMVAIAVGKPPRVDVAIGVAALLVFSRGGHITLFDGYFTFELVLATFLAIHWGDRRPWSAAIALALVAAKPTYILPLGFLLLARGNVKAIVYGAVISIVTTAAPMLWLAHHEGRGDIGRGIGVLREQIAETQEVHRAQDDESPVHSWTRVDALAVFAKWTKDDPKELLHLGVMGLILVPVLVLLNSRRRLGMDDGLAGLTGALILVAMLVSLYHQSYDVMVVVAPLAGLALGSPAVWQSISMPARMMLAVGMLVPLYNYFSTRMILGRLDPGPLATAVFTSLSGVCLMAVLVGLMWMAWKSIQSCKSAQLPQSAPAA